MAEALIKYETLNLEQIDDIMSGRPPREPESWHSDRDAAPPRAKSPASEEKSGKGSIGGTAGEH